TSCCFGIKRRMNIRKAGGMKMPGKSDILVVEDDEDISQLLCKIIKKRGYYPKSAYTGTAAILYLEQQTRDLIVLALMLPGMHGKAVLEKIREQGVLPVIIISSKNEKESRVSTLRSGADDFITRPFDIDEVSAGIDSLLRRYRYTNTATERVL